MSEFISIELQLSAVVLAEELSFLRAAQKLGTCPAGLYARIGELTALLECSLFQERGDRVEVSKDGKVLIDIFRAHLRRSGKVPK